ncbi:MAG TPA: DMT family transporter [Candidatus Ornithomonoglobus merdipullorum]|uniref:DMT family transporter n=1 Tax=Candidatus Ornithomonoglobus merdipullorum TaxID=2840895 RepID=A0A9D1MC34_9FIRM|nr:DMT family transporter [Candidatus Ornithomonoglobus merdipullorum]
MRKFLDTKHGAVIAAVICNLLWGSAYPGIKIGYELFGITDSVSEKLLFAGLRFILAGIMVLAAAAVSGRRIPVMNKNNAGRIVITGLVYTALQYVFFYIGLSNTTGTNGSIVNSSTTFMALAAGYFFCGEKVGVKKLIGALIGFAGVITVFVSDGISSVSFTGEGFILIAAACFVAGSMLSKRAAADTDAMTVTGYNLLIGGAVLAAAGFIGGGMLGNVSMGGIAVLVYLAFLSAAAFTLWTMLLKSHDVGSISVYNFIIPVSGTILSAVFMREDIFSVKYLISLVLVCLGIVLVNHGSEKTRS